MGSKGVRVLAVVALAAASLPLLAGPARADDFAPEISSFRRTSEGLLGGHQLITIEFTATDEGPAGLAYAYFTFATPLGGEVRVDSAWMNRAPEGTFVATHVLSPWAASGEYRLKKVEVSDREWNSTVYERGAAPGFDFAAADFSVDNSNEDTTAPILESAQLFQKSVLQGTPVVILYDVADDRSGVQEVVFIGWTPTGGQYSVRSLPELGAVGPATWLVPLAAASGEHKGIGVAVTDRAGNSTWYATGEGDKTYAYPPGATLPPHQQPDPASFGFTVEGRTGDRLSPQMTAFSPVTPDRRRLGDVVALDYSAFDAGTGIDQVTAMWTDGAGHQIDARKTCGDLTRGPLSVRIEDFRSTGTDWKLEHVAFVDELLNVTVYYRDGRVAYQNTDPGPPTHAFDLSSGDFHLEAGPPAEGELAPTTTELYCPSIGGISLGLDDPDVIFGDVVTTVGTVTVADTPVEDPIVAVHQYLERGPRLVGVVQGDDAGAYRESFVARENSELTATFLGADGPNGADVSTSRKISLRVRPRVTAALSDDEVPVGAAARVTGSVTPGDGGDEVVLQRRTGGRWRAVREGSLDGDGSYGFTVRPSRSGTFRYRVAAPASRRLAAGRSGEVVLHAGR